jgi:hypothetical protein
LWVGGPLPVVRQGHMKKRMVSAVLKQPIQVKLISFFMCYRNVASDDIYFLRCVFTVSSECIILDSMSPLSSGHLLPSFLRHEEF